MPDIHLDTSVRFLRGVGPSRATLFESLGVSTVRDLIAHYPFRYDVFPRSVPIGELEADRNGTVIGSITRVRPLRTARGNGLSAEVVDGTGRCRVQWFNSTYLSDRIIPGRTIRVTGRVGVYRGLARFANPRFDLIADDADPFASDRARCEPVYPATGALSSKLIGRMVADALQATADLLADPLPDALRKRRRLPKRRTAVLRIHQPVGVEDAEIARRRLAYDELLVFQLALRAARRSRRRAGSARPIEVSRRVDERIRRRFPFRFTPGQDAAVERITRDLDNSVPMNRLLQGDVGSGKTAVALYTALAAVASGRQALIAAPTEILARQHFAKTKVMLSGSRVDVQLLIGGLSKSRRRSVLDTVRQHRTALLFGTHAILEQDVRFADLGVVVVDEQHRFGVAQRARMRTGSGGAAEPHCLVMTATPIPRTLAMTIFGDADITTIHDSPPGRRPITTRTIRASQQRRMWRFVRERLDAGEQAYVVLPLVEESEQLDLADAVSETATLRDGPMKDVPIELLHGRMSAAEKEAVMTAFVEKRVSALVSTTVVEVGVDVPNASVMVIRHAERFGLSQLHQLRGRVGRGAHESHCFLVSDAHNGPAAQRLRALCATDDGFRIAEEDLRIRGPGELLGTRQHGLPELRAVRLADDLDLMTAARDDAAAIIAADPSLASREHAELRRELQRRYRAAAHFAGVA